MLQIVSIGFFFLQDKSYWAREHAESLQCKLMFKINSVLSRGIGLQGLLSYERVRKRRKQNWSDCRFGAEKRSTHEAAVKKALGAGMVGDSNRIRLAVAAHGWHDYSWIGV